MPPQNQAELCLAPSIKTGGRGTMLRFPFDRVQLTARIAWRRSATLAWQFQKHLGLAIVACVHRQQTVNRFKCIHVCFDHSREFASTEHGLGWSITSRTGATRNAIRTDSGKLPPSSTCIDGRRPRKIRSPASDSSGRYCKPRLPEWNQK